MMMSLMSMNSVMSFAGAVVDRKIDRKQTKEAVWWRLLVIGE
jgi:hypothetical protein